MDKLDIQIGEEMRRITGTGKKKRWPVMSGVVKAVDSGEMTCTVQLTADADGVPTDGVLLNVVTDNTNGMYMLPAVDAHCVVAEVDGPGQLKQVLWASEYTEVQFTVGSSKFTVTDGTVKVQVGAQTKLTMTGSGHKIEAGGQDLGAVLKNVLLHIMAMTVTTGMGPSGTPINFADFENDYTQLAEILL